MPFVKHVVAVSASESPDMAVLGLSDEHLCDAMAEIARHVLKLRVALGLRGRSAPAWIQ